MSCLVILLDNVSLYEVNKLRWITDASSSTCHNIHDTNVQVVVEGVQFPPRMFVDSCQHTCCLFWVSFVFLSPDKCLEVVIYILSAVEEACPMGWSWTFLGSLPVWVTTSKWRKSCSMLLLKLSFLSCHNHLTTWPKILCKIYRTCHFLESRGYWKLPDKFTKLLKSGSYWFLGLWYMKSDA